MIGFLQITTNMSVGLDVPWPRQYISFMNSFNFLNFEIINFESMLCAVSMDFYNELVLNILFVPVVMACAYLLVIVPTMLQDKRDVGGERGTLKRRLIRLKFWKLIFFTLFLIYPNLSRVTLQMFQCIEINGVTYMVADFNLICYDDRWKASLPIGIIGVLLYPIGIPIIFFFYLFKNRKRLWTSKKVRYRYGLLFAAYHKEMWFFEMCDMLNKLFLTSLVGFFALDLQMPSALFEIYCFLTVILCFDPYLRHLDDRLQQFSMCIIFNMVLLGWTTIKEEGDLDNTTEWVLSLILIFLMFGLFSVFVVQGARIFLSRHKWKKRRAAYYKKVGNNPDLYRGDIEMAMMEKRRGSDSEEEYEDDEGEGKLDFATSPESLRNLTTNSEPRSSTAFHAPRGSVNSAVLKGTNAATALRMSRNTSPVSSPQLKSAGLAVPGQKVHVKRGSKRVSMRKSQIDRSRTIEKVSGPCGECQQEAELHCLQCNFLYCQMCFDSIHGENFVMSRHQTVTHMPSTRMSTRPSSFPRSSLADAPPPSAMDQDDTAAATEALEEEAAELAITLEPVAE
jgi:hypothetical protein